MILTLGSFSAHGTSFVEKVQLTIPNLVIYLTAENKIRREKSLPPSSSWIVRNVPRLENDVKNCTLRYTWFHQGDVNHQFGTLVKYISESLHEAVTSVNWPGNMLITATVINHSEELNWANSSKNFHFLHLDCFYPVTGWPLCVSELWLSPTTLMAPFVSPLFRSSFTTIPG